MRTYLRLWIELLRVSWQQARGLTAGVFALETGSLVGNVGIALALRAAVNDLVAHRDNAAVAAAVLAAVCCAAVLLINRLHGLVGFFLVVEKTVVAIDDRLTLDLATLESIEHLERSDFHDRITVLKDAPRKLVTGMWTAVRAIFTFAQLVIILVLLGRISPVLFILLALAVAPLWCDRLGRRIESRRETATAEQFRLQQHLFELATDAGAGKEIRVARAGDAIARLQADAWRQAMTGRFRARMQAAGLRSLGWAVFSAGFVLALAIVIGRSSAGAGTAGNVILVVTLTVTLQQSVRTAVTQLTTTMSAGIYIDPYLWLRAYLDTERRGRTADLEPPARLSTGIKLDGVSYTYPGTTAAALDDLQVTLAAGSVVALVGEFGSGKTTLVKLLSKFYQPSAGVITVDGTDLADIETEAWRRRTSAAYQDFGRYPQTTFAEAVGIGDIANIDNSERVSAAIRAADAELVVRRLPDGLRTRLSRLYGGIDLSEGQWQKTALARASMRADPLLFMLDEPTASLDAPSEHAIFQSYMAKARGLAARTGAITLVVSHRLSTVAGADLILVLDHGRLVEQGSHEELLASGGRYSELYSMQATAYSLRPGVELLA